MNYNMSAERHEDSIVHSGRDWFIANIAQLDNRVGYVVRKHVIDTYTHSFAAGK